MKILDYIVSKKHHQYRRECELSFAEDFARRGLSPIERVTERFEKMLEAETPVILKDEKICYMRTFTTIPEIFTEAEWNEIKEKHYIHELGFLSNLTPDYEKAIEHGLLKLREDADEYGRRMIDAILAFADRYREEAVAQGREDIAKKI